ncbi:uncharacterized protein N7459_001814 [Penicillium hispanicum]|uniref:uncharacterized protein n=1 Tax=Penicillium hispanicum TaxID=1080232 RepID=UPI0025420CF2|nr:uncharacterized protein N7459_001814 [Penicillium hispanicum]KAJ5591445.1 hypothetical protein N7459_001814 [Penicillium hispanicum]
MGYKLNDFDVWFDDDEFIGTKVSFPSGSVWKLETKIREHAYQQHQRDCEELGINSEARGVFCCSKVSGDGPPTAVIKIRLQIPWLKTTRKRSDFRAKQAVSEIPTNFSSEIEALSCLTKARCSSTPSLFSYKVDKQSHEEWVPGGYKLYILMEKLSGSDPSALFFSGQMSLAERDRLRSAFKAAWLETVRSGVVHTDDAMRNLIWDSEGNKCYLVDWEYWSRPSKKSVWVDRLYISWNLAQSGPSNDYFDMSDWVL